jgi:hypothetical protein
MFRRGIINFQPQPLWAAVGEGGGGAGAASTGAAAGAAGAAEGAAGAAAGAAGAAGAGEGGQQQQAAASWRDALRDDLRAHPSLARYDSQEKLADAYVNLEKTLGRDKVVLPKADGPREEWDSVYAALGRPEKPEAYNLADFKAPEGLPWSPEVQTGMLGVFHKAGLNDGQVRELLAGYGTAMKAQYDALNQQLDQHVQTVEASLKKEWGADYEARRSGARLAAEVLLAGDYPTLSTMRMADGTMALDHPLLVKAFARAHDAIGPEALTIGKGGGAADPLRGAAAAKSEIERIRKEQILAKGAHPLDDTRHPEHKAMTQRMQSLYAAAHPQPQQGG